MSELVRRAVPEDIDTIVALTIEEAREAEGLALDPVAVRRGVEGAFREPPRARYWVAEGPGGQIVASTSIVTEWSNFHGGEYWWVQSLYITPAHRGRGLVERLLERLWTEARGAGALDLRLYAHRANTRALRTYERCGFTAAPYEIMTRPTRTDERP